jgi:DNA polymerase-3 subunit chi
MTKVSFHILPTESQQDRYLFACKMIEKAYRSGCFCYVMTDDDKQSQLIDDLLWTFRAGSFIPHQIYTGELPEREKVILIGSLIPPENWQHTLFNLSARHPDPGLKPQRILEILDNSETTKAVGRERYRRYQQSGMTVIKHQDATTN